MNNNSKPFDLLNDAIGKEVLVICKGNTSMRGTLRAFDAHINLVLENAAEIKNGEIATKYGKILVRGDNVIFVSP